jgi:hypothetical protein
LSSDDRADAAVGAEAWHAWPVVARIWRTVDVERTVEELGLVSEPLDPDELLGARVVLVRPPDGPPVALLEPTSEGRLTAALASAGEGDAGVYVAPPGGIATARLAGTAMSREARGPFGRAALISDSSPRPARFVVIVETPPATIG